MKIKTCSKMSTWALVLLLHMTFAVAQNVPPAIVVGPPAGPMYVSSNFYQLTCLASGTPTLGYSWSLNGAQMNLNAYQATQDPNTGVLSFASGPGSTGGPYGYIQCMVSNAYGTAVSNVTQVLQIQLTLTAQAKEFSYTANPGSSLQLPCDKSALVVVPRADIVWQLVATRTAQQYTPINTDQRVQVDETGTLNIAYVLASDAQAGYFYRCHFTNVQNNALELSTSYSIVMVNSVQAVSPTSLSPMYTTPSPVLGLVGNTVILRCFFGGAQGTAISWVKPDGTSLNSGGRFTVGTVTDSGKLTITNVQQSDQGIYTCTGIQIGLPSTSATLTLIVNAVPTFPASGGPQNGNYVVGGNVSISCNTAAIPPAAVTWYRNGMQINTSPLPPKMTLTNNGTTLTINNLCKSCHDEGDLGVIQCNASNPYGSVYGQAYVNVFDATVITQGPTNANLQYPNPITFNCLAKSDIATPPNYTWLFNNRPINSGMVNTSMQGTLATVYINIQNDTNGGKQFVGTWTCIASNGISSAVASATLNGPPQVAAASWFWWSWIPLVVFFSLLLLALLLLLFCCCCYRNRGNTYPVDEKERKGGNDPEKDLAESGFHDYQRSNGFTEGTLNPAIGTELNGMPPSLGSMNGSYVKSGSEENLSMNGYAHINGGGGGKFNDGGSYVDAYNADTRHSRSGGPGVYSVA